MPRISAEAISILTQSSVSSESNTVTLPTVELPRKLYEEVDDVLTRIGGKWDKKLKAHLFPYNPAPLFNAVLASEELPPKNPTAFFPTPDSVVSSLITLTDLEYLPTQARILEPSAGTGAIARRIRDLGKDEQWTIDCCEILPVNKQALINDGFNVVAEDFAELKDAVPYDAILMNPPFGVDGNPTIFIDHIYHAWSLLKRNGRFAAVVPTGWITASTNKKILAFRNFVADYMQFEEVGSGAFKDSGTMVNTAIVYGDTAESSWKQEQYNGWPSYHAWHVSLWMDNDYDMYTRMRQGKNNRATFDSLLQESQRNMWKQYIPVRLTEVDVDDLWKHYSEEE